ncbi:hypothetical protein A0H81_10262 [Grifola frondosa]|uniref:Uncharacterized protein n=1 Tax=Grifola frondosa TaxID=5627 RepID=A0A1C7M3B4_GRIFR|nr:hypothetical protein A0H81_10262 [Grifola frondosa]
MVAIFILTRAVAISALFVGAFPLTHAAPIPERAPAHLSVRSCASESCRFAEQAPAELPATTLSAAAALTSPVADDVKIFAAPQVYTSEWPVERRNCRQAGCLFEVPDNADDADNTTEDTTTPTPTPDSTAALGSVVAELLDIIAALTKTPSVDAVIPATPSNGLASEPVVEPIPIELSEVF